MHADTRPIGIFDSGIGGFSVLTAVRERLPAEPVVYLADHRYAPYGERSLDDVAERVVQIGGQMIEAGCKLVVVACNSASAAALHELRATYPDVPFVGMEPAVKPAALRSRSGVVGVLATAATFQGELFASVLDRHGNGVEVIPIVGAGLAALVEAGEETGPDTKALLDAYLSPALDAGMDTLVLGCTHYPFLRASIAAVAGDALTIIDPAPAIARQAGRVLDATGRTGPTNGTGATVIATTGDPTVVAAHAARLLGVEDAAVRRW